MSENTMSKAEKRLHDAFVSLVELNPEAALAAATGMFVSIVISMVENQGIDPNQKISINGGENRDITIHAVKPPINTWIDWHYTPENPYPVLDGDPLVHVRFADNKTSINPKDGARPISYWHEYGNFNPMYVDSGHEIIAYMILDPNDHD